MAKKTYTSLDREPLREQLTDRGPEQSARPVSRAAPLK